MVKNQNAEKKPSQSEKAYRALKDLIMTGEIAQGEVLSIMQLSERLRIGRTPISTACQRLEYDGLLRIVPKQGVWVNTLSFGDARELYESRAAIEVFFNRKALEYYTDEDVKELRRSLKRQQEYARTGDRYAYAKEDGYFHAYAMRKYANATLMAVYERFTDRLFMLGVFMAGNPKRLKSGPKEHAAIIECVEKRDTEALGKAVEHHIMSGFVHLTGANMV